MRQHYRKRRIAEMNVVPYIDVMLVLLIIFMITSPLLTQGVDVELPAVKQAKDVQPEQNKPIVVTANAQNELFLNDEEQAISITELLTRVTALRQLSPNAPVLVRGDAQLAYGEIVKIMSLLQEAGVDKVGLLTQPLPPTR